MTSMCLRNRITPLGSYLDGSMVTISDAPWPGFTPDLLSIILVTATQAKRLRAHPPKNV